MAITTVKDALEAGKLNRWIGKNVFEGNDDWQYSSVVDGSIAPAPETAPDSTDTTRVYRAHGYAPGTAREDAAWDDAVLKLLEHKNKDTSQQTKNKLKEMSRPQVINVPNKTEHYELIGSALKATMFIGPQNPSAVSDEWTLAGNPDSIFTHIHIVVKKDDLDSLPDSQQQRPHWLDRGVWGPDSDHGVVSMELENYTPGEKRWWIVFPYVLGNPGGADDESIIELLKQTFESNKKKIVGDSTNASQDPASFLASSVLDSYAPTGLEECAYSQSEATSERPWCIEHLAEQLTLHLTYLGDLRANNTAYWLCSLPDSLTPSATTLALEESGTATGNDVAYGPIELGTRHGAYTFSGHSIGFEALANIVREYAQDIEAVNEQGNVQVNVDLEKEADNIEKAETALVQAVSALSENLKEVGADGNGTFLSYDGGPNRLLTPDELHSETNKLDGHVFYTLHLGFQEDHELATISIKRRRTSLDAEGNRKTVDIDESSFAAGSEAMEGMPGILYNSKTGTGSSKIEGHEIFEVTARTWTLILHGSEILRRSDPNGEMLRPVESLLWFGDSQSSGTNRLFDKAKPKLVAKGLDEKKIKVFAVSGWSTRHLKKLGPDGRSNFGRDQKGHRENELPPRDETTKKSQWTYQEYLEHLKPDAVVWALGANDYQIPRLFRRNIRELVMKAKEAGANEFYWCGLAAPTIAEYPKPPDNPPLSRLQEQGADASIHQHAGGEDTQGYWTSGNISSAVANTRVDKWIERVLAGDSPESARDATWRHWTSKEAERREKNNTATKAEIMDPDSELNRFLRSGTTQAWVLNYFDSYPATTKSSSQTNRQTSDGIHQTEQACERWAEDFIEGTELKDIQNHKIAKTAGDPLIASWDCFLQSYLYPPVEVKFVSEPDDSTAIREPGTGRTHEQIREAADENPFKTVDQLREETSAFAESEYRSKMAAARDKYQQVADQVNATGKEINEVIGSINNIVQGYQQFLQKYNIDSLIALALECLKSQLPLEIAAQVPDPKFIIGQNAPWRPPKIPKIPTMILPDAPVFDLEVEFYSEFETISEEAIFQALMGALLTLARELLKECKENPRNFPEETELGMSQDSPLDEGYPQINLDDLQGIGPQTTSDTVDKLRDIAGDLGLLLNPTEICALLRGEATNIVIDIIRRYTLQKYPDTDIATFFSRRSSIVETFSMLGSKMDLSVCDIVTNRDLPREHMPVCADDLRCALLSRQGMTAEEIDRQCAEARARDLDRVRQLVDLLKGDVYEGAVPECVADLMGINAEPASITYQTNEVIKFMYEAPATVFDRELSYFFFGAENNNPASFANEANNMIPVYAAPGQSGHGDWRNWLNDSSDAGGYMVYTSNQGYGGSQNDLSDKIASDSRNYLPDGGLEGQDWLKKALSFARINQMPFVRSYHGGGHVITRKMQKMFMSKGSAGLMESAPFRDVQAIINDAILSIDEAGIVYPPTATYRILTNDPNVSSDGYETARINNGDIYKISYLFQGPDDWDPATAPNPVSYVVYNMQKPPNGNVGEFDPYVREYNTLTVRFPPPPGADSTAFREKTIEYNSEIPSSISDWMKLYAPVPIKDNGNISGNKYIGMPVPIESFAEYVASKWSETFKPSPGSPGAENFENNILPKIREAFKYGFDQQGGLGKHGLGMFNDINLSVIRLVLDSFVDSPLFDRQKLLSLDLLGSQQCPPAAPGRLLNIPKMIEEIQNKRKQNICLDEALTAPALEAAVKAFIKVYVLDFILRVMFLFSYFRVSELIDDETTSGSLISELLKDDIVAKIKSTNGAFYNQIARMARAIVADKRRAELNLAPKNELHELIEKFRRLAKGAIDKVEYKTRAKDSAMANRERQAARMPTYFAPSTSGTPSIVMTTAPASPAVMWATLGTTDPLYYISGEAAIREIIQELLMQVSDEIQEVVNPVGTAETAEQIKLRLINDFRDGGVVLERFLGGPDKFLLLVNGDDGEAYQEMLQQGTFLLEKYINIDTKSALPNDALGDWLADAVNHYGRSHVGRMAPHDADQIWEDSRVLKFSILPSHQQHVDSTVFKQYFKSWKYGLRLSYAPASDLSAIDWLGGEEAAEGTWVVGGSADNLFYDEIRYELETLANNPTNGYGVGVPGKLSNTIDKTKAFFAAESVGTDTIEIDPPPIAMPVDDPDHPTATVWLKVVPTFVQRRWKSGGDATSYNAGGIWGAAGSVNAGDIVTTRSTFYDPLVQGPDNGVLTDVQSKKQMMLRLAYHQDHTGQLVNNQRAAHQYGWYLKPPEDFDHNAPFHDPLRHGVSDQCPNVCNEILLVGTRDITPPISNQRWWQSSSRRVPSVPHIPFFLHPELPPIPFTHAGAGHGYPADHSLFINYGGLISWEPWYNSGIGMGIHGSTDGNLGILNSPATFHGHLVSDIFTGKSNRPWLYKAHNNQPQPYLPYPGYLPELPGSRQIALATGWQPSGVEGPAGEPRPYMGPRYGGWVPFIDGDGNTSNKNNNRPYSSAEEFSAQHAGSAHDGGGIGGTAGNSTNDDMVTRYHPIPPRPTGNNRLMKFHPELQPGNDYDHPPNGHCQSPLHHQPGNVWSVCRPGWFEAGWVEVKVSSLTEQQIEKLKNMDLNNPEFDGNWTTNPDIPYYQTRGSNGSMLPKKDWRYVNGLRVTQVDKNGNDVGEWYCIGVGSRASSYMGDGTDYSPHPGFYEPDGQIRTVVFDPDVVMQDIQVAVEVNSTPLVEVEVPIPNTVYGGGVMPASGNPIVPEGGGLFGPTNWTGTGGSGFLQGYDKSLPKLKELLVNTHEFKYLFDFVFPVSRIRALAAIYGMSLGLVSDEDFGFTGTVDSLKQLIEVLLFGDDYRFEDSSIVEAGGAAGLKACMEANASTNPANAFNKEIAKMIFMTPLMILKSLAKITSPNIMIADLLKNEIMSLISQIQGIAQQAVETVEDTVDAALDPVKDLANMEADIDQQFEMAVQKRGVCATTTERAKLPDLPPSLRQLINDLAKDPSTGQKPYDDIYTGAINMNWQMPENLLPMKTSEIALALKPFDLFMGPGPPLGPFGLLLMLFDFLEPAEQEQVKQALAAQQRIDSGSENGAC